MHGGNALQFTVLGLFLMLTVQACLQPQTGDKNEHIDSTPSPTPPKPTGFELYYEPPLNTALIYRYTYYVVDENGNAGPKTVFETVTLPLEREDDKTKVEQFVVKAFVLEDGAKKDICAEHDKNAKHTSFLLYRTGQTYYGGRIHNDIYLPQKRLTPYSTWTYAGLSYTLENTEKITTPAGTFSAVKITYTLVTNPARVKGTIWFDENRHILIKEEMEKNQGGKTAKIENVLIKLVPKLTREQIDMNCINAGK